MEECVADLKFGHYTSADLSFQPSPRGLGGKHACLLEAGATEGGLPRRQ
jgi:hypothetical protein